MADGVRINLKEKVAAVHEHWNPALVDTIDDYDIKIVKLLGDFVWHRHADEDELFVVLNGSFRMDFRDRQVPLRAGEMIVVPRGTEHKPYAETECEVLLLERRGVVNTGDAAPGAYTRRTLEKV
jgi:mannose-6-phosphate isomerase-like protein (cupin superfamily)